MMSETVAVETLPAPTGARMAVRYCNVGRPFATLAIQHGIAEHSGRYGRFQQALAERGYASVVHDHRGHGLTEAADSAQGYFAHKDGWEKLRREAMNVALEAKDRTDGAPLVAFGHSMGGLVAFDMVTTDPTPFAGAAIWNIAFMGGIEGAALRALLKAERFRRGSDAPSAFARKLTFDAWNKRFAPNRTGFDWLSRDRAEVDAYVADSHAGHEISIGMWLDVLGAMQRATDDARLAKLPNDMPFHLLGGEQDPVTNGGKGTEAIATRLRKAGLTDVTSTVLNATRHEALNEVNRDTTTNAFIDWLDARFAR